MNDAIESINEGQELLAIIIYGNFRKPGIHFLTNPELSQQLAYMCHPSGKQIEAHVHNPLPREVIYTQEVLFIRSGKLRVDFYGSSRNYLESRILGEGDVILLVSGGHGFEMLEETEMIEVKQGPHVGESDKTRFKGITASDAVVRGKSGD